VSGNPQLLSPQSRRSPLHEWFQSSSRVEAASATATLHFDDLSSHHRLGCKGPAAESWLSASGFKVPVAPNSVAVDDSGILVARLATSEFLVEELGSGGDRVCRAAQRLESPERARGVYHVPRADLVLSISGPDLHALLRQICSVNFTPLFCEAGRSGGPVVLTSMIGVSVVAWPRLTEIGPGVTLWIDPSFAHYFWTTLLEVARGTGVFMIGGSNSAGD
jgi:sarcosine oxidase, subunit gamma